MNRTYSLLIAAVAAVSLNTTPAAAQELTGRDKWADSARVLIEVSVHRGDLTSVDAARTLLERALTAFPNDPLLQHYQGYALYRRAILARSANPKAEIGPLLQSSLDALNRSEKKLELPETFALQSAVMGQMIGLSKNPIRAMTLGPKSNDAMTRGIAENAKNPRVWLMRGIGAIFTPSMWGGGLDKAERYLKQSLTYFENDAPARPLPSWGHAEAYVWLGQIYAKQGKADAARAAFEAALKVSPDFGWARALIASPSKASAIQ